MLFVDFDNIFSGLLKLDRDAAHAVAGDPGPWIRALATWKTEPGVRRSLLVQRAYMNPAGGWVQDSGHESASDRGRLYFSRFRQNLTNAGFEVVDCPALTYGLKNAADIRMVIDVLQALDAPTRYDEFVIASADADFTPVLQLLRGRDRRTLVISAGNTAAAYRSVADGVIEGTDGAGPRRNGVVVADSVRQVGKGVREERTGDARDACAREICGLVERSPGPVLLSNVGNLLRDDWNGVVKDADWFGYGGLGRFVTAATSLEVGGHWVWDPEAHEAPGDLAARSVPRIVERVCRTTGMPRLKKAEFAATFEVLARYANEHDRFNLTECTRWTRDRLADQGCNVARPAVGWVVKGAVFGGFRFDEVIEPEAIREAFAEWPVRRVDRVWSGVIAETSVVRARPRWRFPHFPSASPALTGSVLAV